MEDEAPYKAKCKGQPGSRGEGETQEPKEKMPAGSVLSPCSHTVAIAKYFFANFYIYIGTGAGSTVG